MRVRVAALADYASISVGDKLNVLGIFSNIMATAEPIVHPQMQLVVQFEFDSTEAGLKKIKVVLQDEDGVDLFDFDGEMNVPRGVNAEPSIVNQILVLNNTQLPRFGRYEFRVLVNDRVEAEIPLTVTPAQTVPAPPAL